MDKKNSYLSRLKFDEKLFDSFKAKYLTNIRIVILLVILITAAGVTSFFTLPRRLNPEVKIPIVSVTTILPGASPQDVESLLTEPLENTIKGVTGISSLNSVSNESVSTIIAEFNSTVDPEKAEVDIKSAVDLVTDLPDDAQTPNVRRFDFEDQPVWIFAVKSKDPATLSRFAIQLQELLENNSIIDRVTVSGLEEQEIQILADPEKISNYNINPLVLSSTIQSLLSSYPAGNITSESLSFPIGQNSSINSAEDLRNALITTPDGPVKLSDIATVAIRTKPGLQNAYIATSDDPPLQVATFSVYKNSTATIDAATEAAQKIAADATVPYKDTIEITTITDSTKAITQEFGSLTNSFRDTLLLVFITFLIFLGIRQALIAVLTIPLTFLVTFAVINAAGLSLNFLTLFSLLLSLGLLVDDTIVVVTSMTAYYRTKKFTPEQTGLLVWRDLIVPIWSTTITTAWAFVPLLLATGIIGEFIKSIPIVVATTLYASTAIAVLITIPLMIVILKLQIPRRVIILAKAVTVLLVIGMIMALLGDNPLAFPIIVLGILLGAITFRVRKIFVKQFQTFAGKKRTTTAKSLFFRLNERLIDIEDVAKYYRILIQKILSSGSARRKLLTAVVIFSLFSYLLVPFGFVTNEFFPKSENDYVYVNLELPSGTNTKKTSENTIRLLETLRKTEGIEYITAEIGRGIDPGAQDFKMGTNLALFTLNLPDKEDRKTDSLQISNQLRETIKTLPATGKISVVELSGGPPAGAEVQIQLLGDDLSNLDFYANMLMEYLQKKEGVINVSKSINPGTSKLTFTPDAAKLSDANITPSTVGIWMRTFTTGLTIKSVEFEDNISQDIVFRMNTNTQSPEDLGRLSIPNQQGEYFPLLSLGKITLETNPTTITRLDTRRTISVSAGVSQGYSVSTINSEFLEYAQSINLPDGYEYQTGGVNEENQRSITSILQAMLLAGLLILATMVIQFRSYRKALIVMLVIPLAVSGVFIVFALTGTPLSFPALIGILSLFGIVVTHAMFLVDKFNRNLTSGMAFTESIVDGAASRLEPVFLGSLTTIVGLIPISLSNPLWRGLGGAIIAGLSFSGIIMLFFIPVMYYIVYHKDYEHRQKTTTKTL